MIDLYTWSTPNGRKISILLEELKVNYKVIPINIMKNILRLRRKNLVIYSNQTCLSPNNSEPILTEVAPKLIASS